MSPSDESVPDACSGDHMTTPEVAAFARTCVETVRRHARDGRLRSCGGIRRLVFDRSEVERWFKAGSGRAVTTMADVRSAFVRDQLRTAWGAIEVDRKASARRSS